MEIKEKINKIEEVLELDENTLSLETELASLDEWDSVAVLSTMVMLDEDFAKSVKGTDLKSCKTVADIVNLMD